MSQFDMTAPAILFRTAGDTSVASGGKASEEVEIAHGPFVIMAHGYLAQPRADRSAFWIRSARRDMMPAEIEEAMRRWNHHSTGADESGRRGAPIR